jgi:YjbE family integral membrane protein
MIVEQPGFWLAVLQIIWIDILLSGDNAVVIALACRKLPPRQRVWGVVLGTGVAIGLRLIFAMLVTTLMKMAYLKLVGGVLLLWIAVKLLGPEENGGGKNGQVEPVESLWRAIRIIAIADVVMSLLQRRAIGLRACGQHSADHGRRRDRSEAARALPDRRLGRCRPTRLDCRRDHRQGSDFHRPSRSRCRA